MEDEPSSSDGQTLSELFDLVRGSFAKKDPWEVDDALTEISYKFGRCEAQSPQRSQVLEFVKGLLTMPEIQDEESCLIRLGIFIHIDLLSVSGLSNDERLSMAQTIVDAIPLFSEFVARQFFMEFLVELVPLEWTLDSLSRFAASPDTRLRCVAPDALYRLAKTDLLQIRRKARLIMESMTRDPDEETAKSAKYYLEKSIRVTGP